MVYKPLRLVRISHGLDTITGEVFSHQRPSDVGVILSRKDSLTADLLAEASPSICVCKDETANLIYSEASLSLVVNVFSQTWHTDSRELSVLVILGSQKSNSKWVS